MPLHFAPTRRGLVYQPGLVAGARVTTPHLMWRTAQARFRSRAPLSCKTELAGGQMMHFYTYTLRQFVDRD
jgi:hypothetical protein